MKTRPLLALILVTALWSCSGEDQATKKVDMSDVTLSEATSESEGSGISGMADFNSTQWLRTCRHR